MVQREARQCDIETWGFVQIFDPTAAEDPTFRSPRIGCHDVIAGAIQCSRKPTISASHFEDTSGWCWQV
jgi:hypothetical protein